MPSRPVAPTDAALAPAWPPWLRSDGDGITLAIAVQPNAKRSEVAGEQGGSLKIRIAAPPVDGVATEALLTFLAQCLGIKRRAVTLMRGATSRLKVVSIRPMEPIEAYKRLASLLVPAPRED